MSSSTSAPRPGPRRTPECVERIALGGTSQGGVFDARTSAKAVANPVNGRQAELWGDEQWLLLKQVVEERKPKVIGIDRSTDVRVHRRPVERRAAGDERGARRTWTSKLPRRRTAAARADRVAPAGGRSVLRKDDRARLADDADDVLGEGDRAGHDAHERSRCGGGVSAPTIRDSAPGSSRASACSAKA